MVNKEDVAEFLLQKGYLLTALEFYQELLEDDGTELEGLKDYFIQQQPHFETESPRHKPRRRASDAESPLFQHNISTNSLTNDLSEKLKEKDERLSLLEYELRRAREDITNLRVQLTNIVKKPQMPSSTSAPYTDAIDEQLLQRFQREHIREHEIKILNYLIRNYLVQNKYSLTAITFSEEMPEELTTWESVGLDTPEPPPLLTLHRYFFDNEETGIQGALAKSISEASKLKKELSDKDVEYRATKKKMLQYQKENEQLQAKAKELDIIIEDLKTRSTTTAGDAKIQVHQKESNSINSPSGTASPPPQPNQAPQCPMRVVFKSLVRKKRSNALVLSSSREIDSPEAEASSRIAQEISKITSLDGDQQVVQVVADCLPHIVTGVIINKREELIPIILVAISQHPSNTERFALTKLLFNLIKKPNELQRQVIMNGCVALASIIGPQRTETELLTHCWEQIGDKYAERRVLVADSCGQLAAYVPTDLRLSLILSILQQMVEDKTALVRSAVARNVALLVTCFETSEKYAQVAELFIRLLRDSDPEVGLATRRDLVPAMVHWSDLIDAFHSKFLNMILSELQSVITTSEDSATDDHSDQDNQLSESLLSCLLLAIPHLKEVVFASNPTVTAKDASAFEVQSIANLVSVTSTRMGRSNSLPTRSATGSMGEKNSSAMSHIPSSSSLTVAALASQSQPPDTNSDDPILKLLSDKVLVKLKASFDNYISTQPEGFINTKDWPVLDWVVNEFVPRLAQIILAVPASQHSVISSLVEIVSSVCVSFGVPFTKKVVKNVFITEMRSDTTTPNSPTSKKLLLLPVYLSGVLTSLDEAEIIKYLHELIVNISVEENGWGHNHLPVLKNVVGQLCAQANFKSYTILDTLCDMVAHPSNQVRSCVVSLFNVVIPTSKAVELSGKILPALITLANDPDILVRTECIEPLANIAVNSPSAETLDKLTGAFDKMLESDSHNTKLAVVVGLGNIISHLTFKRQFRDTYILPLLVEQTRKNNGNANVEQRKKMANALFEAFRAFASATLTKEVIEQQVLPGLKLLILENVEPSFKTMVHSMIQDMKNNTNTPPTDKDTANRTEPFIRTSQSPYEANSNSSLGVGVAANATNDKGSSTKRTLFGKLDAASITSSAASITSSLKVDFDKAMPKWTWKNR